MVDLSWAERVDWAPWEEGWPLAPWVEEQWPLDPSAEELSLLQGL